MDILEKILELGCSINKYDFKDDNDVIGIIVNKKDTDMFNDDGYAFLIDKNLNESDSKLVSAMLYKKLVNNNCFLEMGKCFTIKRTNLKDIASVIEVLDLLIDDNSFRQVLNRYCYNLDKVCYYYELRGISPILVDLKYSVLNYEESVTDMVNVILFKRNNNFIKSKIISKE